MNKYLVPLLVLLVVVAGCTSSKTKSDKAAGTTDAQPGAVSSGVASQPSTGMDALTDPSNPLYNLLQERVIYFEYNESEIQEQYRAVIEAHATYLSQNPQTTVTLEGHADERGSREYNLALGERRAMAVEQQLTVLGVAASQIRTVSYGEERPISAGHDESSWGLNRRVEIIY
ncbi:MAG: hypothetical protein HW386_1291 [Gammaproteobacteria bacterium]|nr:hypothetical protein [Gammaproteobacteria bacterium]